MLTELLNRLSWAGITPYYVFQCRPTEGNSGYSVPLEEALAVVETARAQVSGLAARVRFVMSHRTGKIEVLGRTEKEILFRYHRAAKPTDQGRLMVFRRVEDAHWFDDYRRRDLLQSYRMWHESSAELLGA